MQSARVMEEQLAESLSRALAVPETERDADVSAFIEGVQLEKEARQSLSLPAGGARQVPAPQGPGAEAKKREVLAAFIKVIRADYLAPLRPPTRAATVRHLMAHLSGLWDGEQQGEGENEEAAANGGVKGSSGSGSRKQQRRRQQAAARQQQAAAAVRPEVAEARGRPLARAAQLYVASSGIPGVESVHAARDAAAILADPVAAPRVAAALQDLEAWEALGRPAPAAPAPGEPAAPPALLTPAQLQHACHCLAIVAAISQLADRPRQAGGPPAPPPLSAAQRAEIASTAAAAADSLLELEPLNPKSWALAGAAASLGPAGRAGRQLALERCLRAAQLGREQGRPYWEARGGDMALAAALGGADPGQLGVEPEAAVKALEAFQRAEPALQGCKHLLPQAWVGPLEESLRRAQTAPLLQMEAGGSSGGSARGGGLPAPAPAALPAPDDGTLRCAGCRSEGQGQDLRRCGRCKQVLYCSVDCQRAHWASHKKACAEASAA